ncbi:MAG: retropepsin-like domain-containing protein [Acidobacteriota bacterium]|nr:retropepsin-like domain-containing protein [Acidobacteriota bacterium]
MTHRLAFHFLHEYDPGLEGITLNIELSHAQARTRVLAKLDTGASLCIFQREHGEALGLDIEHGAPQRIATATGSFLAYGHELMLTVPGLELNITAYFAGLHGFPRNVLGRRGWLDQVRIALIDYDGKLYLSHYNDTSE